MIDDVISRDDDDVINYARPADAGKSIVTTDIRRADDDPAGRPPAPRHRPCRGRPARLGSAEPVMDAVLRRPSAARTPGALFPAVRAGPTTT